MRLANKTNDELNRAQDLVKQLSKKKGFKYS